MLNLFPDFQILTSSQISERSLGLIDSIDELRYLLPNQRLHPTVICYFCTGNITRRCLVWFDLFVHPFSHICNNGHVNYRLQFKTQFIIYGHPHNII
jgi:hypothetical protein